MSIKEGMTHNQLSDAVKNLQLLEAQRAASFGRTSVVGGGKPDDINSLKEAMVPKIIEAKPSKPTGPPIMGDFDW